jgi:metal-responsive CopG/Arc/MetJ family transcriptional regulator
VKHRKGISFDPDVYQALERFCQIHSFERSKAINTLLRMTFHALNKVEWQQLLDLISKYER